MNTTNKETVKAIQMDDSYLVSIYDLNLNYKKYFVNGLRVENMTNINKLVTLSVDDKVEFINDRREVDHYQHSDGAIMSIDDYKSKNTYYDEDSDEDEVLMAIANRKALQGYEAVYKEPVKEAVEFEVIGTVENTQSDFIDCSFRLAHTASAPIYTVYGGRIAMDEYLLLSNEYKEHAKFEKPDRSYLRFTKINNNFVFGDTKPFGDNPYVSVFKSLPDAQAEEQSIREVVRATVKRKVFPEELTDFKASDVISKLVLIKKNTSEPETYNLLNTLISDIEQYRENTQL